MFEHVLFLLLWRLRFVYISKAASRYFELAVLHIVVSVAKCFMQVRLFRMVEIVVVRSCNANTIANQMWSVQLNHG